MEVTRNIAIQRGPGSSLISSFNVSGVNDSRCVKMVKISGKDKSECLAKCHTPGQDACVAGLFGFAQIGSSSFRPTHRGLISSFATAPLPHAQRLKFIPYNLITTVLRQLCRIYRCTVGSPRDQTSETIETSRFLHGESVSVR